MCVWSPGGLSLKLDDGLLINVKALAGLLGNYRKKHPLSLKAVLFNACSSASHARALSMHGVPSIGVELAVSDAGAHEFSTSFFTSMFGGENDYDVPKAFDESLRSFSCVVKDNDPDLLQYQLYIDGRIDKSGASQCMDVKPPPPPALVPSSELVRRVLEESDKPLDKLQICRAIHESRRLTASDVNKELYAMEKAGTATRKNPAASSSKPLWELLS